ncbi:hypothetical protein Y032_0400g765 [Ancylostoma ceylanicum]|uniref:Uncharacterized protein n=1 Tax=Ancylostoma ceylanicum TaxID=53326 RepID=A0A016RRN6_9BILA|nr:hypothetical protein Y032_0400g765 [Ancylostoma ceylanicum]
MFLLFRNIKFGNKDTYIRSYKSYILPLLEYAVQVCFRRNMEKSKLLMNLWSTTPSSTAVLAGYKSYPMRLDIGHPSLTIWTSLPHRFTFLQWISPTISVHESNDNGAFTTLRIMANSLFILCLFSC